MKMETVTNGNTKIYKTVFPNIQQLVGHCENTEMSQLFASVGKEASKYGDEYFTKTKSFQEANDLLKKGWDAGAKALNKKLQIANKAKANKEVKRAVNDVVGFQANVPRYLQGIPTNMINQKKVVRKQKTVNLVKAITYSAMVSPERILEDSVKFLQIVQEVEKMGMRANVFVVFHSIQGNEEVHVRVKIKSAGERLNISKMSYPLVHPSFLRRHMFKYLEVEKRITRKGWTGGYGQPGGKREIEPFLEKGEFFLPTLIKESEAMELLNKMK